MWIVQFSASLATSVSEKVYVLSSASCICFANQESLACITGFPEGGQLSLVLHESGFAAVILAPPARGQDLPTPRLKQQAVEYIEVYPVRQREGMGIKVDLKYCKKLVQHYLKRRYTKIVWWAATQKYISAERILRDIQYTISEICIAIVLFIFHFFNPCYLESSWICS